MPGLGGLFSALVKDEGTVPVRQFELMFSNGSEQVPPGGDSRLLSLSSAMTTLIMEVFA